MSVQDIGRACDGSRLRDDFGVTTLGAVKGHEKTERKYKLEWKNKMSNKKGDPATSNNAQMEVYWVLK